MSARKKQFIRPERLLKKLNEARFFLQQLEQDEGQEEEFGHFLSAFLSAFASVFNLVPLVGSGRQQKKQLAASAEQLRDANPALNYLLNARDAEVHTEGTAIVMTLTTPARTRPEGFAAVRSRFTTRFEGRFQFRYGGRFPRQGLQGVVRPVSLYRHRWYFREHPMAIVDICRACFNRLEAFVNKTVNELH